MISRVVYTLGAGDELTTVNGGWIDFARENHGEALGANVILGRPIWDFIADESTRAIYRRVFQRVRNGAGPARFAFRCDAPALRRLLQMRISRRPSGGLVLATDLLLAAPRVPVALLDPAREPSGTLVRLCAWCQRVHDGSGHWLEVEEALAGMDLFTGDALPRVSHGMCDDCSRVMNDSLEDPTPNGWKGVAFGRSPMLE